MLCLMLAFGLSYCLLPHLNPFQHHDMEIIFFFDRIPPIKCETSDSIASYSYQSQRE